MKKILYSLTAVVFTVVVLGGCSLFQSTESAVADYNYDEMKLVQLEKPYEGQPLVEIETTLGTFKAVLYPEYAPNTVNNFIERINEGFYNHKSIFSVLDNVYFLTGASNEEGTAGVTSDGKPIPNEYSVNLWPFKGAMMSYYGGEDGYGDSRFFVLGKSDFTQVEADELRAISSDGVNQLIPDELIEAFLEKESVVGLSGLYTIFGQTIEGMDVVEKLLTTVTDTDNVKENPGKPIEEIFIEKITLSEYKAADFE